MGDAPQRFRFGAALRLHGQRQFAAVYDARVRKHAGPLTVVGKPNGLGHCRLGLSVGRVVGNAVARARVKRMLREAFRLGQHESPAGYDLVIVVHPHEAAALAEYQQWLAAGIIALHAAWQKRAGRA
jgi:ribonuclease P protein component